MALVACASRGNGAPLPRAWRHLAGGALRRIPEMRWQTCGGRPAAIWSAYATGGSGHLLLIMQVSASSLRVA